MDGLVGASNPVGSFFRSCRMIVLYDVVCIGWDFMMLNVKRFESNEEEVQG
jgi:hypothetical protein